MEQAAAADDLAKHVEADLRFHEIVISRLGPDPHGADLAHDLAADPRLLLPLRPRPEPEADGRRAPRPAGGAADARPRRDAARSSRSTSPCRFPRASPPAKGAKGAAAKPRATSGAKGEAVSDLLTVKNLRTGFQTHGGLIRAVDGVDFSIPKGGTLGVVGESGQRQVRDRALDHEARRRARPRRGQLEHHLRRAATSRRSTRTRWRRSAATTSR